MKRSRNGGTNVWKMEKHSVVAGFLNCQAKKKQQKIRFFFEWQWQKTYDFFLHYILFFSTRFRCVERAERYWAPLNVYNLRRIHWIYLFILSAMLSIRLIYYYPPLSCLNGDINPFFCNWSIGKIWYTFTIECSLSWLSISMCPLLFR